MLGELPVWMLSRSNYTTAVVEAATRTTVGYCR